MKRLKDDSGIAMITALLATLVIAALAAAGFTLSSHTLEQSGNDRRRAQAIHAAEAGIDDFINYLATVQTNSVSCASRSATLSTSPPSTFVATATYYVSQNDNTPMTCPSGGNLSGFPGAVSISSTGTSAGVSRKMEGYYGLSAVQGGYTLTNGAVYSDGSATFSGQATMTGNPDGADLVSNSNVLLGGGGAVYGNVSVLGSLTLKGGTDIKQNATAKLNLDMSGGGIVRGDGRSSTQSVLMSNNSTIYGNAYYCTGSAPTGVQGSTFQDCNPNLPATKTWSQVQFTYNSADWTAAPFNYTIHTFNDPAACTQAQTYLATNPTGNNVVRINSTCTLSYGGQTTINVNGNLAIISNGPLDMGSHAQFAGSTTYKLFLMFNILTARPCATAGISFNSQAIISPTLDALLYTPCVVSFGAQSSTLTGQIVAGQVNFGAGANITTVGVQIPGQNPNGFQEVQLYRREII